MGGDVDGSVQDAFCVETVMQGDGLRGAAAEW